MLRARSAARLDRRTHLHLRRHVVRTGRWHDSQGHLSELRWRTRGPAAASGEQAGAAPCLEAARIQAGRRHPGCRMPSGQEPVAARASVDRRLLADIAARSFNTW